MEQLVAEVASDHLDNEAVVLSSSPVSPKASSSVTTTAKRAKKQDKGESSTEAGCIRFLPAMDIHLLKQVSALAPYEASHGRTLAAWDAVATNLKQVDSTSFAKANGRNCKARADLLIAKFKKEEMESLKKSGTEEEYTEREQLLEDIVAAKEDADDVANQARSEREAAAKRKAADEKIADDLRDASLTTMRKEKKA